MCKDDGDFDAERAYNSLKVCKRSAPLPSLFPLGAFGYLYLPSAKLSTCENSGLFGWRSCWTRLPSCKIPLVARLQRNVGSERFCRARPARARELHESREQRCKASSCARANNQLLCSAMLHAPRQPNGGRLHHGSLASEGLPRPVRCRLARAGNQTGPLLFKADASD